MPRSPGTCLFLTNGSTGGEGLRVLVITSEWPSAQHPSAGVFVARQVDTLRAAGVHVEVFSFRGKKSPLRYLRAWFEVRRRLGSGQHDLAHAQFGQSGILALPKRIPLVVTFRGSDLQGAVDRHGRYAWWGRLLRLISRAVALRADRIIVVSESLADHLPAARPYEVIPSGLDLDRFRPASKVAARERLGLPPDERLILFAGNPAVAVKRFSLARQAIERLRAPHAVRLVTASDVPHEQMPDYMNACDLLLLTSRHEGSPNMVKEALACNLPVVSVDVGDVKQRIGTAEGCVVCADDRADTIARGIETILGDSRPFQGRHLVCQLGEETLGRKLLEIYRSAAGREPVRDAR